MQDQTEQDLNLIRSYCGTGDIDNLEKTMDVIEKKWSHLNDESYVHLIRAACDEINSCRFPNMMRARRLIQRLAVQALSKADQNQMDVQLHLLVSYLRIDYDRRLEGQEWLKARRKSAELWLGIWRRLEGLIDETWTENDPGNDVKPYTPPANVRLTSGMPPEKIDDPKIRAEYEAHLKKNAEIAARNYQQRKLRKVRDEYSDQVERYIITLYSRQPFAVDELNGLLANIKDEAMKERILKAVNEKAQP